ncbi:MAG: SpoIIE family protein phosphatase [Epulopiscium sp.]|nr:SpoIIE family protein phosphatase [Candidatus Epulonipiscium sp.]
MDTILVVDDIEQNVELISRYLINSGYNVITANNGASAIKKAQMLHPDLIILDIMMPGISGYDVCKTLKNDEDTKYISILVVTALDSKETRVRALGVGADDFITKSFDKLTLLSKVKSLLRIKHLSDQLKKQYSELQEKNNITDYQLKMARQIQRALIQEANFSVNDVKFTSKYMPALDIGGDLYDIIKLDEDSVGVFIADVSGHGISAALLTSMIKMLFRSLIPSYPEPNNLLSQMNNEFSNVFINKINDVYASAFYAKIDTKAKKIYYSNAGQSLPLFVKSSTHTVEELAINGLPIGLMDDASYGLKSASFEEGDFILFYTDGLSDCLYKNSPEEFTQKLKELLLEYKEQPSEEIIDSILGQFYNSNKSSKYENDDVSIIICKI